MLDIPEQQYKYNSERILKTTYEMNHLYTKPTVDELLGHSAKVISHDEEVAIRCLPGNVNCADCQAFHPQWADISFGILICLTCAGIHRSFGVSISIVKSLELDALLPHEQRALEIGGNSKWLKISADNSENNLPLIQKYTSLIAKKYKQDIQIAAKSPQFSSTTPATRISEEDCGVLRSKQGESSENELLIKCITCNNQIRILELDLHSHFCSISATPNVKWRKYEASLQVQPHESLGFSLVKYHGNYAQVSKVMNNSQAHQNKITVGSFIVGVNGTKTKKYDEIVNLLKSAKRSQAPINFQLVYAI